MVAEIFDDSNICDGTGAAGYATGAAGYATSAAGYATGAAGYATGAAGYALFCQIIIPLCGPSCKTFQIEIESISLVKTGILFLDLNQAEQFNSPPPLIKGYEVIIAIYRFVDYGENCL